MSGPGENLGRHWWQEPLRRGLEPPFPWRLLVVASLGAAIPTQLLRLVIEPSAVRSAPWHAGRGLLDAVDLLIATPWIETLLMAAVFIVLRRIRCSEPAQAVLSTLLWAGFHVLATKRWTHGFYVAWPFLIFSVIFLEGNRRSQERAVVVTALAHMSYNLLSAGLEMLLAASA